MFHCPHSNMTDDYYRANQGNSYIRILHASPNTPAIDIYANDNLIIKNLAYKEISQYFTVSPGNYNIKIFPSGQTINPIINTNVSIPENTVYNIAAIGTLPNIILYAIQEPMAAQNFGRACVRFAQLSPETSAVDISLSNGTKMFHNLNYKDITDYACIPAGTYTFIVHSSGTNNTVLTIPNIKLDSNNYYTIYIVNQIGESTALEAVVASEPRK